MKENGVLQHTFSDKNIALVPVGGCNNLKHWRSMDLIKQFNAPYCVLLDSDKGTESEQDNAKVVAELKKQGVRAYTTRKRELENYIHPECIGKVDGKLIEISDEDDAKAIIPQASNVVKREIIAKLWTRMTFEQIREVETYVEDGIDRYEFTEMVEDFLSIVS